MLQHVSANAELIKPLGDWMFSAGEAVAGAYVTLCGVAYMSGKAVARRVAAIV